MTDEQRRSALVAGVEHFNGHRFWEAHEAWERYWLDARDESRLFFQGLIQLAAAYYHVDRGTLRGAGRLFDAALEKLSAFPPGYCGIDREEAIAAARSHRRAVLDGASIRAGEFPKLRYN